MIRFDRWWLPDAEQHLPKRMAKWNLRVDGRLTYQYPLYELAMKRCTQRRVAVDVGAHVGLMSYWMARDFASVIAFEPVDAHRECWRANMPRRETDVLLGCALGAKEGAVKLAAPSATSSGGTRIVGPGPTPMRTLDSFRFFVVDLLKIDCEGYEVDVLAGAKETIARCRPVVAVEQRAKLVTSFGHGAADAVKWLKQVGASLVWTDRSDYILEFAA
jgi:FkbM family methyltransferase